MATVTRKGDTLALLPGAAEPVPRKYRAIKTEVRSKLLLHTWASRWAYFPLWPTLIFSSTISSSAAAGRHNELRCCFEVKFAGGEPFLFWRPEWRDRDDWVEGFRHLPTTCILTENNRWDYAIFRHLHHWTSSLARYFRASTKYYACGSNIDFWINLKTSKWWFGVFRIFFRVLPRFRKIFLEIRRKNKPWDDVCPTDGFKKRF